MINNSTFFCGRYGLFVWPIWSVADVVVADMVQTR